MLRQIPETTVAALECCGKRCDQKHGREGSGESDGSAVRGRRREEERWGLTGEE